jgi:hypothetical protein
MSSRIIGSLGLGASGSVITCMHKQNRKEIHTQISIYQGYKNWIRSADPTDQIGKRATFNLSWPLNHCTCKPDYKSKNWCRTDKNREKRRNMKDERNKEGVSGSWKLKMRETKRG